MAINVWNSIIISINVSSEGIITAIKIKEMTNGGPFIFSHVNIIYNFNCNTIVIIDCLSI